MKKNLKYNEYDLIKFIDFVESNQMRKFSDGWKRITNNPNDYPKDFTTISDKLLIEWFNKSNLSHRGYSLRDKELLLQFFSSGNECGCMEHENIEDYFEQYYNKTFKNTEQ